MRNENLEVINELHLLYVLFPKTFMKSEEMNQQDFYLCLRVSCFQYD